MKTCTTHVRTGTLQNKVCASAFCTSSARGAATAKEPHSEASLRQSSLGHNHLELNALGGKLQTGGSTFKPQNSFHHHLHPYQPGQIFKSIIPSKHMEVNDPGRL